MTSVLGVDPGSKGGFALYGVESRDLLWALPMPTIRLLVGRTKKPRVDPVSVWETLQLAAAFDCKLMVIEAVGGRPKQSAMHAFTFGQGYGLIIGMATALKMPIEAVPPAVWKRTMNVPATIKLPSGRLKKDVEGVAHRTQQVFPGHLAKFRTKRGAWLDGPMEAAHLAKMGAERLRHVPQSFNDWREKIALLSPVISED